MPVSRVESFNDHIEIEGHGGDGSDGVGGKVEIAYVGLVGGGISHDDTRVRDAMIILINLQMQSRKNIGLPEMADEETLLLSNAEMLAEWGERMFYEGNGPNKDLASQDVICVGAVWDDVPTGGQGWHLHLRKTRR